MASDAPNIPPRSNSVSATFNYLHLDADKVLSAFGKYGRYQMLAYMITTSVQILFALNMMIMPFITEMAKPMCDLPAKNENLSPIVNDGCHVHDTLLNTTIDCLSVNGAKYTYIEDKKSTISMDFDLVCEHEGMADHATSIFLFGGMVVSPFVSQLSDILGRRPTFLLPLYVTVIANLICAAAPTYTVFLIFRFISGVATTSFSMTGYVLCMESVALEFRSLIPVLGTVTWVLGYMLAGAFSIFFKNWRMLYLAASVPGLLTIPLYWFTPESLHWLLTKKKDRKIRKIVMSGTYWALSLYSHELSDDGKTGYFLSGLVELPAGFFSVFLLIAFKRKTVSFISLFATAIFMLCTIYVPLPGNYKMIFPLLAKSTNSIVWSSQPLLYSEVSLWKNGENEKNLEEYLDNVPVDLKL
uniref:MFS domain-containing protein n=2 Tax=Caenorhabditis japonica TaxID=281687 RepID=A0A8R1HG27_CAEJA